MPKIYKISKVGTRLIYKIRHHKGHGIHSPFVFNFITKVIEEKTPYYAYFDIRQYLEGKDPNLNLSKTKTVHLIFKTVNYFKPNSVLELGSGIGIRSLYITAISRKIRLTAIEPDENNRSMAQKFYKDWRNSIELKERLDFNSKDNVDCLMINLNEYKINFEEFCLIIKNMLHEHSFIIIDGIRTNKKNQLLWKELVADQNIKISLDLFYVGILFFDTKYHKQNFKLSF